MRRTMTGLMAVFLGAGHVRAQTAPAAEGAGSQTAQALPAGGPEAVARPAPAVPKPAPLGDSISSRWLELQAFVLGGRYRYIETSAGMVAQRQGQFSNLTRGRLKLDPNGSYTVNGALQTGDSNTGGWNNTGIGTGDGSSKLFVKQLYLAARPVAGLELQYGGIGVLRGESTEITSYDNDVYLTGQRASLRRPKDVFFDEISVSYAYLGDARRPGVWKRFERLDQSNYHQLLLAKRVGKRTSVSADYSFQDGIETVRAAVRLDTKGVVPVDAVRFENYRRLDVKPAYGFALGVDRTLYKRLGLGVGYARIDANYGGLNADRFGRGQRLFLNASLTLTPEFSLASFYTRAFGNDFAVGNRTRLDVILNVNVLKGLQRTPLFAGKR